jgi:hypothetical protein
MYNYFINGLILGDAYINPYGALTVDHSSKQQKYVEWKFEQLKALGVLTENAQIQNVERTHKRTKRKSYSLRFNTKSVFKQERALFYPKGQKVIASNFYDLCNPLTLAIWYMDDGGLGAKTPLGMVLDVSSYTSDEIELVRSVFINKFGISTNIHKHGPHARKLYIISSSAHTFCNLIRPYVIKSMLYKLAM